MKKSSKLLGILFATSMFLGACDQAKPVVNPADNNGTADKGNDDNKPVAHEHSFGEWVETPATCAAEGKKERVCACGEKETEVLPKLTTHTFGEWQETPATCAADGKKERTCSVCGFKEEEAIAKLTTHSFGEWVETPATCAVEGKKERTCSICGHKETEVLPKTDDHNYVDAADQTGAVAPTCGADGTVITECSVCGAKSTRVEPKTGNHDFGEWDVTPATYEADGKKERVCSACGFKEEEVIPKLIPTWSEDEQAILDTYFYGIQVPFLLEFMDDNPDTVLEYDDSYGEAVFNLENSSAELLSKYASLFEEGWFDNSDITDSAMRYQFEKFIQTEDGLRVVAVIFYGMAKNDAGKWAITADGSGLFVIEVTEPYVYNFAATYANTVATRAYGSGTLLPELQADYYDYNLSTYQKGYMEIDGYYLSGSQVASVYYAYHDALEAAGFKVIDQDQYGWDIFASPDYEIAIELFANPNYRIVAFVIYNYPGLPSGDALSAETLSLDTENPAYKEYSFAGASGAEYKAVVYPEGGMKLNKGEKAGFVVTKSVGTVHGLTVVLNAATLEGYGVVVYGSNNPFDIEDMYDEEKIEELGLVELGQYINEGEGLQFFDYFDTEYAYIGIAVPKGNAVLDLVDIEWTIIQAPVDDPLTD